jgi:hypothetical protein
MHRHSIPDLKNKIRFGLKFVCFVWIGVWIWWVWVEILELVGVELVCVVWKFGHPDFLTLNLNHIFLELAIAKPHGTGMSIEDVKFF